MSTSKYPPVAILMGSDSDWPVMENCADTLKEFGVKFSVEVASAHRTPDAVAEFAKNARANGVKVIICAAGGAAHLAGAVAANSTLPVIGVPCPSNMNGLDSLLSTVQMPAGIPVATVAVGNPGASNAAILAVQILSLNDPSLADALTKHREKLAHKVKAKNEELKKKLDS
jgi:phosphoribosylaminoimidazole carboxylase PurE protein